MNDLKVLLVDDEQDIVDTIKYSLELRGYMVDAAYDGLTAVDKGRTGGYDIMILDVMLPGKNGYEVSRILKEEMDAMDAASSSRGSDFPIPAGREYILRTTLSCPAPWSRLSPQRMYCTLIKDEFRLIGAFTSDTTFQ